MRLVFGVLSLLVVVAIIGMLASRQLKATRVSNEAVIGSTADAASTTLREQSKQVQQKVADDVAKALQQGGARNEQAEK